MPNTMLSSTKRLNIQKPTSQPVHKNNNASDIAHSLQTLEQTCREIQQQYETKKLAVEQDIEQWMAIMLQENVQNANIIRSAIGHKITTPSNYQRIGNVLGLDQDHITQLRHEGKTVTDMVRIYTQTRSELLQDVITPLQEIQDKYADIVAYCDTVLQSTASDREKKSWLTDFMKLSQETLRKKQHAYHNAKTLFHKKPGHQAIQKTMHGLNKH